MKLAFEAFEEAGAVSGSANHLLVATADASDTAEAVQSLARRYGTVTEGDDLQAIANFVKNGVADETFNDATLGELGKALADPEAPTLTKNQAKTLAKILAEDCLQ